jgi:hypothetical protein
MSWKIVVDKQPLFQNGIFSSYRSDDLKRRAFPFLAGREGLAAGGDESHP